MNLSEPMLGLTNGEELARLKRLGKPVEMMFIPDAVHMLQKPWHRMISMQGNVDWFCFWLQGEEDSANALSRAPCGGQGDPVRSHNRTTGLILRRSPHRNVGGTSWKFETPIHRRWHRTASLGAPLEDSGR